MIRTAAGQPACLPEGWRSTSYVSLDSRHRPQSVLGFTTSVPRSRARGSTPCLPASQPRVFSLKATRLVSSKPTDRPVVGSAATTTPRSPSRTPSQPGLEAVTAAGCSTARLVPRATRYTYHTMNGTNRTALTIYAAAVLCPVRLRHESRRRGAPLIDYGAVTMGSTAVPLVGRTRRVGGHLSVALSFNIVRSE